GAAAPRPARDGQLAAEQPGDLAADGEAEAGAAIFAAGGAVGLLERLEDDALLVLGNAYAGILDDEGQHLPGAAQLRIAGTPAARRRLLPQAHMSPFVELEGVGKQVLDGLLRPLAVGVERARQRRVEFDEEVDLLVLRQLREGALGVVL